MDLSIRSVLITTDGIRSNRCRPSPAAIRVETCPMATSHTTRLVNPTLADLTDALAAQLDSANHGTRTRRVEFCEVDHWPAKVMDAPEGILSADGGSVPNSYKYVAETTDVVVAWWTDGRGRKTVTIGAGRLRARSTSYGCGHGTATPRGSAWSATFPERAGKLGERRRERIQRLLDRMGPEGADDRLQIGTWTRHLSAACDAGLILADHPVRPKVVQVVVRDATTGQRHHITVPPKFATPGSQTYQRLGGSAARVRAAVAWTFGLKPSEYAPAVEA